MANSATIEGSPRPVDLEEWAEETEEVLAACWADLNLRRAPDLST
jgi:hypothetical protein